MASQMFGNIPKLCSHYKKSAASIEDLNKYTLWCLNAYLEKFHLIEARIFWDKI